MEKNTKKYNKNFTIVNMEHKASSFSVLLDESIRGNDNENSSLNKIITQLCIEKESINKNHTHTHHCKTVISCKTHKKKQQKTKPMCKCQL